MVVTRYVSETPGINGGYPVVAGTRTPVRCLLEYRETYAGDLARVQQSLPHLSPAQIQGALDYCAAYPHRVDEDQRTNQEAWEQLTGQRWPG